MINLPKSCLVDKFLAKKLFYEKANASQSVKKQFIDNVDKITWMYKISQDTININKTEDVEEIQVFELLLKQKCDLKEIINVLTKKIPYPILFHIKYDEEFQYAIKYNDKICYSEWNKDIDFNFSGLNLNLVYKDIVRKINNIDELNDIDKELEKLKQINELEKQIKALDNKIRKEKQFKIKAEYNHRRNELIEEISRLRDKK